MRRLGGEKPELNVVADQIGSPTYARDLARFILEVLPKLETSKTETYHFSNEGVCSWYDFAVAIMDLSGFDCNKVWAKTNGDRSYTVKNFFHVFNLERYATIFRNLGGASRRLAYVKIWDIRQENSGKSGDVSVSVSNKVIASLRTPFSRR